MQAFLLLVNSRQCLDMTVGKIENGLERGFVKTPSKLSFKN